jgi:hypothetical protein
VDHHIDPDVISRLQQDTSHFPREFLDTEEDTGAFVLAVADSVHQGIHEGQINGEAYIGMWITGNFSVLKILLSFTKLTKYIPAENVDTSTDILFSVIVYLECNVPEQELIIS